MAQSNNRFSYGGALGGLIAADETIQKELTSRLDNIQKAITNADMALDLNLAQKYREQGIKADIQKKQADARKGTSEANVAERTEDSLVKKAAADVEHTEALTTSARSQAAEADARTREVAANAQSTRAAQAAQATSAYADAAYKTEQTRLAQGNYDLKAAEVQAKVNEVAANISNQRVRLTLMADQIAIDRQNAQTAEQRAAVEERAVAVREQLARVEQIMSVSENELNIARTRALNADASLNLAKAAAERGGAIGAASGLSGEKLDTRLGMGSPEEVAGSVVNEILLTNPAWEPLRPGKEGESTSIVPGMGTSYDEQEAIALRSMARDKAADALLRYRQLASMGMVGILAAQDVKRVLAHTMQATYPTPEALITINPREKAFTDAQNMRLQSLRTTIMNTTNPAQRQALGENYSNAVVATVRNLQENGFSVPADLLFEFNLIQAQPKPLNITVRPGQ